MTTAAEKRRVAIVGFSETTRNEAPFSDPSFEIWGLGSLFRNIPRFTRWFEMHSFDHLRHVHKDTWPAFDTFLKTCPTPLYMREAHADYPTSVAFPIERLTAKFFPPDQPPYWTNTIAYMIALAVEEGFDEIHVFGVDMAHAEEYVIQRPGVTYIIGFARGLGVKVVLPPLAALMRSRTVYGYEEEGGEIIAELAYLRTRRTAVVEDHRDTLAKLHNLDGRSDELAEMIRRNEERRRGGTW